MKAGHNQTEIARILEVHKSTISRELRRNRGLCGYRPQQAERLAVTCLLQVGQPLAGSGKAPSD